MEGLHNCLELLTPTLRVLPTGPRNFSVHEEQLQNAHSRDAASRVRLSPCREIHKSPTYIWLIGRWFNLLEESSMLLHVWSHHAELAERGRAIKATLHDNTWLSIAAIKQSQ
jgi:hypothetical protein